MMGWEWPAPGEATCGAWAVDRGTEESFFCNLARGHRQLEHHWQGVPVDEQFRSVTWIERGSPTFVGSPHE